MDPFEVLNLPTSADDEAISSAYLKRIRECTPDKQPEQFEAIRAAYETIQDERKRIHHALFHCDELDKRAVLRTVLNTKTNTTVRFTSKQLEQLILNSLKIYDDE